MSISVSFASILLVQVALISGQPNAGTGPVSNCPITCPDGWVRFGFSEHCYKMSDQPARLDTFWEHDRLCKAMEPTSYVAVMNTLREQAAATPIAWQYAPKWFPVSDNALIWLGAYTDDKGWKFLDGSDEGSNYLMTAADIIGPQKNNTCLVADAKTLGMWKTRPCSDKIGAAICEMAPRSICGKAGGVLQIAPVEPSQLNSLLPKMSLIPYYGPILSDASLDTTISGVGTTRSCWWTQDCKGGKGEPGAQTWVGKDCRLDCPSGWISADSSPTSSCYSIPLKADADVLFTLEGNCRTMEPTAHVAMINGVFEQAIMTAIARNYGPKWKREYPNGFLWLGSYAKDGRWNHLDNSDSTTNLVFSMANVSYRTPESLNGKKFCLRADLLNANSWNTVPCDNKNGIAICEMPKKILCASSPGGQSFKFPPIEISAKELQQLYPAASILPHLDSALTGYSVKFSPSQAVKINETKVNYGDGISLIVCSKTGGSRPDWTWLTVNGDKASAVGQWVKVQCKAGSINAFHIPSSVYLGAWSRCYNQGYESIQAMPVNQFFSGWGPFLVEDYVTEHYQVHGGLHGAIFTKIPRTKVADC